MATSSQKSPLSWFEFCPPGLFYLPVIFYWILQGLKYGDFSIPTAANPRIEHGGLCGESKTGILDMAGPYARRFIPPYVSVENDEYAAARALILIREAGLKFPLVLKPDIGCHGIGVRKVDSPGELASLFSLYPVGVKLMLQKLVQYPVEAGVFYVRHPHENQGRITSVTYKSEPVLTGNGVSTLRELLLADSRMQRLPDLYLPRIAGQENKILEPGEELPLVFTGNHCQGSIFENGCADITPELTQKIDEILQDVPDFYFGRLDLKVASREDLRAGKNFQIIEINGISSEAIHIWDRRTTLREAYKSQFYHYAWAFRIGAVMKKRGWKTTGAFGMLWAWLDHRKLMASYPSGN